jgi:hypothetical protein
VNNHHRLTEEAADEPDWPPTRTRLVRHLHPDAARARHFYQELFSWPVKPIDETYALVGDHGGQPAGGIGQAGPSSPYVGIAVYFPVDDVDSAHQRSSARTQEIRQNDHTRTDNQPASRERHLAAGARRASRPGR